MRISTVVSTLLKVTFASNILFMAPFPDRNHWNFLVNFVDNLLGKGHHLTVVTHYPREGSYNQNYTEILLKQEKALSCKTY